MPRLAMKAAILAAGVSSASAWASMVAHEGTMEGAPEMLSLIHISEPTRPY